MVKADTLLKKQNAIKDQVNLLTNLIVLNEDVGLKTKAAKKILKDFTKEVDAEFKVLIDEALKPVEPRSAKKILREIKKQERLTPELLAEIRELLKKEPNPAP